MESDPGETGGMVCVGARIPDADIMALRPGTPAGAKGFSIHVTA